jgi:undecaprenol kinase
MKRIISSHHPIRHVKSFRYAFSGIFHALLNEPNFRVQLLVAFISLGFGIYFGISNVEWALLVLSMGILISAEMINTVVEELMDHIFKESHDVAKIIKDLSAGFVLVTAATAFVIFLLIFGQRLTTLL